MNNRNGYSKPSKSRKTLERVLELSSEVDSYLHNYGLLCIPVLVNSCTVFLDLEDPEPTNSNLFVSGKGTGKTTLLHKMMSQSNDWIISLPDKVFESKLAKRREDDFRRKVWVLDDLATSFRGLNTKQREQLMGFFNSILSKKEYERQGSARIEDAKISCQFGFATENYSKYRNEMFLDTFLDRVVPIKYNFQPRTVKKIVDQKLERERSGKELPELNLPYREEDVDVRVPQRFDEEISDLAMRLQVSQGLSGTRGATYVKNFIRACALMNGRKEVREEDFGLLSLVLPLHKKLNSGSLETRVRELILDRASDGSAVTGRQIKEEFEGEYSESTISSKLSDLREVIPHRKVSSSGGGYDYEFYV